MKPFNINHREVLAQGWTTMFVIFTANLVLDTIRCNTMDTCTAYYDHFGNAGVTMITVFMLVYSLMPILIRIIQNPRFRYVITPVTMFITMSYVAHELGHISEPEEGGKPFGFSHALDIAHHLIGFSMFIIAINWAKCIKHERAELANKQDAEVADSSVQADA